MREIKFRAFSIQEEHYLDWNTLRQTVWNRGDRPLFYHVFNNDWFIMEQYTGLKDKNGKEIYEGDITSLDGEYLAVIKWDEKKASFVADSIEGDCVSEHIYGAELCTVEGNIHENPELLESDK